MTPGTVIGSFVAKLGLDSGGFASGILSADSAIRVFGGTFATFITNPLLGSIELFKNVGSAVLGFAGNALSSAEDLQRFAEQTSVSVETISALRDTTSLAGGSIEVTDRALRNFSLRLGQAAENSGPLREELALLGLATEDLGNNRALEQFVNQLLAIEDQNLRNAIAARAFGDEAGPALLNVLQGFESLDAAVARAGERLAIVSDDDVNRLAAYNTQIGELRQLIDNALARTGESFLAGFVGDPGELDLSELSAAIQDELIPAAREAGEALRESLPSIQEAVALLERAAFVLGEIREKTDFSDNIYQIAGDRGGWWNLIPAVGAYNVITSVPEAARNTTLNRVSLDE